MVKKIFDLGVALYALIGICFISQAAVAADAVTATKFKTIEKTLPRTNRSAELFNVEAVSRCAIRFNEQDLVTTVPFKGEAFHIETDIPSDELPKFTVTGFSFNSLPADKAIYKLVHEAGIKVLAAKGAYPIISGQDLKGDLKDVINKITSTAGVFYTYDAQKKYLKIMRIGKWKLYVPESRLVMITVLDTLRGSGIRDLYPDWENNTISFVGKTSTDDKVNKLIKDFGNGGIIVAMDTTLYRVTPKHDVQSINWQRLIDRFGANNIRSSTKGILGRMIVSTNGEISNQTFINFIRKQATVELVSQGLAVVPEGWRSRFDVGRCGSITDPEAALSVLFTAKVLGQSRISGSLTIDTKGGELTNFPSFTVDLGDSILIFGIPTSVLSPAYADSELAMLISTKLIRIVKETSW